VKRPGVRNAELPDAPSEAQPLKLAAVAHQILRRVGAEDPMRSQELVEPIVHGEAEKFTQLGTTEMPLADHIERQRLERAGSMSFIGRADEPGGLVGDAQRDFHTAPPTPAGGSRSRKSMR